MEVIEELASVPFQQYKAKVVELVGATQANGSTMKVPKQEEAPNPSKESGRRAMQADADQHPNELKQQSTMKISEVERTRESQHKQQRSVHTPSLQDRFAQDKNAASEAAITHSAVQGGSAEHSSIGNTRQHETRAHVMAMRRKRAVSESPCPSLIFGGKITSG